LLLPNDEWTIVPLAKKYAAPVAVVKPVSAAGGPGYVQIRNVSSGSFEVRYSEWSGTTTVSQSHPAQLFYMVADSGRQSVAGLNVQAGRLADLSAHFPAWQQIPFAAQFSLGTPAVFASVQTVEGSSPLVTRIQNCTDQGFELSLQGAESAVGTTAAEAVGWIAVDHGSGMTEDGRTLLVFDIEVGNPSASVAFSDHYTRTSVPGSLSKKFVERYPSFSVELGVERHLRRYTFLDPVVIADMNTTNEADTATVVCDALGQGQIELRLQEETSLDAEVQHAPEQVSVFVAE